MADGSIPKNTQPYSQNPDLGPEEYDIDLSDLHRDDSVEAVGEGAEAESYIRELRHREEEVLKGELKEPYGVDEILSTAGMQASGKMPPLPNAPKKPRTKVEGDYEKQVEEALGRIEQGVEEATWEGRDVDEIVDQFTDELGPMTNDDIDRLYDSTVKVGEVTVPVVLETLKDALQTLSLIEDSLESEMIQPVEIPGLQKILKEIIDKHGTNSEVKQTALKLSNYADVAATAHSAKADIPAYLTEAKHKARTEASKREGIAKQVAYFAQKNDFEQAYAIAGEAAETDPEHFRYPQAVMAKLAGKYDEAEKLFRALSQTKEIKRHLRELKKIKAYKDVIAKTYEGGDLKSATLAAEHAAKHFPLQFDGTYKKLGEKLADYESGAPILLTKVVKPGKPPVEPELRKTQIEKRRDELAAEEEKRKEEAKTDKARKAELDEQRKKREEEKKRLEKEAEELEREAKRLEIEELPLWETVVKVPLTNVESVKEALQRVKDALRVRKLTDEEEIELHRFLQEVERRYPTTTELDADISDINRILKEVQEEEDGEPPYRAFPEAPEVPVEYRKPKTPNKFGAEPVKAGTDEGESAEPPATAEPTAPTEPAPLSGGESEEKIEAAEKPAPKGMAAAFGPGLRAAVKPLELSNHEPEEAETEEKEADKKKLPPIMGAFKIAPQPQIEEIKPEPLKAEKVETGEDVPEETEEAAESVDDLYEAIKEDANFMRLTELIRKLKANPELGAEQGWVSQLRNLPDMLPVENEHKFLLQTILKDLDKKDPEHVKQAIGVIVDALQDLGIKTEQADAEPVGEKAKEEVPEAPEVEVVKAVEAGPEAAETPTPAELESEAEGEVEDIDKTVEELLKILRTFPSYTALTEAIKALRTSPRRLSSDKAKEHHKQELKSFFGIDDQQKIREAVNELNDPVLNAILDKDHSIFEGGELDGKKILGPIVKNIEGEKSLDAASDMMASVLGKLRAVAGELRQEAKLVAEPAEEKAPETARSTAMPEAVEAPEAPETPAVSVAEAPKADEPEPAEIELVEAAKEPESVPQTASVAPESEPVSSEKTESVMEKADVPVALMTAIDEAVNSDEGKKKKLLDLWEAAKGKGRIVTDGERNKALEDEVASLFTEILKPESAPLAAYRLKRLLAYTEKASVEFPSEEEIMLDNMATDILDLLEDDKEFADLKKRLEDIFSILQVDPADYPRDRRKLEDMRGDMKELLLKEMPADMGMDECKTIEEFYTKFRKLRTRKQLQALEKLNDTIAKDKSLEKVIRLFRRLTKSKTKKPKTGGGTPPPLSGSPSAGPDLPKVIIRPDLPVPKPLNLEPQNVRSASGAPDNSRNQPTMLIERVKPLTAESFMERMGFKFDSDNPASIAMRTLLIGNLKTPEDLKNLEAFLKRGEYTDEIDQRIKGKDKAAIKTELSKVESKLNALNVKIRATNQAFHRGYEGEERKKRDLKAQHETLKNQYDSEYVNLTDAQKQAMSAEDKQKMEALVKEMNDIGREYQQLVNNPYHSTVDQLYDEKSQLENDRAELSEGLKRLTEKKSKETVHYRTPEQLLGMINLYFHKNALESDETPDYAKVMADTQTRIDKARDAQVSVGKSVGKWYNRLAVWNYVKPTLTATLTNVFEEDKTFGKLGAEEAKSLAKAAGKKGGVEAWLREIEGTEKHKMETLVPALIGYMSTAVNAGGSAALNTASLPSSRKLLNALRKVAHEYSIEQAEKVGGTSLQKMNAYFAQLNGINKKSSQIKQKIIWDNVNMTLAKRIGLPVGAVGAGVGGALALSAGATALVALGPLAVASAGIGAVGAGAAALSRKLEDPEKKAMAKKMAVRGIIAGGLGALAIGSAPIVGIAALGAGVLSPEIWKNKKKIAGTTAYAGYRFMRAWPGFVLGLATVGFAFRNPRFNRLFGLPWNNK